MTKLLLAALKDKKALATINNEGKYAFQTIAIELSKQPKKGKITPKISISSIKVGAVSSVLKRLTVVLLVSF